MERDERAGKGKAVRSQITKVLVSNSKELRSYSIGSRELFKNEHRRNVIFRFMSLERVF